MRLLLILILLVTPACAAQVELAWDAWDGTGEQPDFYRVFGRLPSAAYDYNNPMAETANNWVTVTIPDGTDYYFMCRAVCTDCCDGNPCESADSNEVMYGYIVVPPIGIQLPATNVTVTWEVIDVPPTTTRTLYPVGITADGNAIYILE